MPKNFVSNSEWWTEEDNWGPWHKKNSKTIQKRSCFDVVYESNEFGARDKSFKSNNDTDIVLIGDSFAEGYGVNYENTSQKYIEELNNLNVLNFGVSQNFGPVQYSIIYDELANKFKHDKLIIYFLPDNDFGENDYYYWKDSKRYRPYYKKVGENNYETFIPKNSIKNFSSTTKKIKQKFSNLFWSSNLFINLYYEYKIYRSNKKIINKKFSPYFDAPLDQQEAAIYFIDKIINSSSAGVILVSIPRKSDYIRFENADNLNNIYWNNYYSQKDSADNKFHFIDLIKFKPNNLDEIFLSCDGHWSPKGNLWAAKIISEYLNKN